MTILHQTLKAWNTPAFADALKQEIEQLDAASLPLQQGLSQSSVVSDDPARAILLGTSERAGRLYARVGIFYTGIIPGCSCADDPSPPNDYTEYCEVQVEIDPETAEASFTLLPG